jgi:3-isopropylmalate/(R)-2-methylmalate dehydratase small subunit
MIYPAAFLTSTERHGLGKNLFQGLRARDPHFPLNQPQYRNSKILLADNNFGCGSSREHAVWSLLDYGYQVVIAKSFADIFSSNSGKNGLLLVQLPAVEIEELFSLCAQNTPEVIVDLEQQCVQLEDGRKLQFPYDAFRKHCLLHGIDDLEYILAERENIAAFFAGKPI